MTCRCLLVSTINHGKSRLSIMEIPHPGPVRLSSSLHGHTGHTGHTTPLGMLGSCARGVTVMYTDNGLVRRARRYRSLPGSPTDTRAPCERPRRSQPQTECDVRKDH